MVCLVLFKNLRICVRVFASGLSVALNVFGMLMFLCLSAYWRHLVIRWFTVSSVPQEKHCGFSFLHEVSMYKTGVTDTEFIYNYLIPSFYS